MSFRLALAFAAAVAAGPALAHAGVGATHSFAPGLGHPLGGLDHLLAMITVGLLASSLGGRAVWALPMSFVIMMLVGAGLGVAGLTMPAVELIIALSVVALGASLMLARPASPATAGALAASFAVFHGFAHGSEMPVGADALGYAAGFALATILLLATGVAIGRLGTGRRVLLRAVGASIAAVGVGLAFQAA